MNWIYSPQEALCCPLLDRVASSRLVPSASFPPLSKSNPMTWSLFLKKNPTCGPMAGILTSFTTGRGGDLNTSLLFMFCRFSLFTGWIAGTKEGGEFPGIQGAFPALLGQSMILQFKGWNDWIFLFQSFILPQVLRLTRLPSPHPTPTAGTHMQMWVAAGTHAAVVGAQQPMNAGTQQTWDISFSPPWTQSKH